MYTPSNFNSLDLEALQRKCVEMEIALSNCYCYMADSRRKEVVELAAAIYLGLNACQIPIDKSPNELVAVTAVQLHAAIMKELMLPLPVGGGACGASNTEDARSGLLGKVSK